MSTNFSLFKKAMVLVCFISLFGISIFAQTVTNGDFETWTGSDPDGWTLISQGTDAVIYSQAVAGGVTGDALQILAHSDVMDYDGSFYTDVTDITPGKYYDISIWAKSNDDLVKIRYYGLQWYDEFDVQIGADINDNAFNANTGDVWTEFVFAQNPIPAPDGAAKLRVNYRVYNAIGANWDVSTIWVDDFTVTEHVFVDPGRTAGDVTQDPGSTGGVLDVIFDPALYTVEITQPVGELVPWVSESGGYPPFSGNWVGIAIDFPDGFDGSGDLTALNIDGTDYTPPVLSAEEIAAGELWYYFEMDFLPDASHTIIVEWSEDYAPETFTITATGLDLEENPSVQDGIDNTTLAADPASQVVGSGLDAIVVVTAIFPDFMNDFPNDLLADILFEFNQPMPAGVTVSIEVSGMPFGDFTTVGGEESLWLLDLNAGVNREPILNVENSTQEYTITYSGLPDGVYDFQYSVIADVETGFSDPVDWFVFAADNSIINVTDEVVLTIPLSEPFEDGFTYFDNAAANNIDWTIETTLVYEGTQSVHNAYGANNNNSLIIAGPIDLTVVDNPTLSFAHIAKTEGNYDHCYIEVSLDEGSTWETIPATAYLGSGVYANPLYNNPAGPCFNEDSYPEWGTGTETPQNSWWRNESFSLLDYAEETAVLIRFRLDSESSVQRAGWYIDDINIYNITCMQPTELAIDNLTYEGGELSWTDISGSLWNIEIGLPGFTPGNGEEQFAFNGVSSNPYTISGLNPETDYRLFIQTDCGVDGTSEWSGPVSFSTLEVCPAPTNIELVIATENSLEIEWDQPGGNGTWDLIWGEEGFNPAFEGTAISNFNTNPILIEGLAPQTYYDVYLRSDCGGGVNSDWVGPITFSTECGTITAPFVEDFENAGLTPDCWNNFGTEQWRFSTSASGNYCAPSDHTTGTGYFAWVDDSQSPFSTDVTLETPWVDISALSNPALHFWFYSNSTSGNYMTLRIHVWNGTAFDQNVFTFSGQTTGWQQMIVPLNAYSAVGNIKIQFVGDETSSGTDFYNDISIDDILIDEGPECPAPTSITANNITPASVDITWVENGTATEWNLLWGESGFDPDTEGTLVENIPIEEYQITGLDPITTYQVYVQAICTEPSDWGGPVSFTTPCVAITPEWLETFDTYPPNECWTEAKGLLTDDVTFTSNSSLWLGGNFANNAANGPAVRLNNYSTGRQEWAITPSIDLGDGSVNYMLEFDLALTDYYNSNPVEQPAPDDRFAVVISTDDGLTWSDANALRIWDNQGSEYVYDDIATAGEHVIIELTGYTGIVRLGFYGESTVSNADNDLHFDNVAINILPDCFEPLTLNVENITTDAADVVWTSFSSITTFDLIYGLAGFNIDTEGTLVEDINANNYSLSSLTPGATYQVYVRSDCGGGTESEWFGPVQFSTVPTCDPPSNVYVDDVDFDNANVYYTAEGTATEWDIIYGTEGFDPFSEGTLVDNTTDNPYNIIGLDAATSYDVYVRSDCSGDLSPWVGPATFSTPVCDLASQCDFTINLQDSYGDGWNGAYLEVYQFGILVESNITLASGSSATLTGSFCDEAYTEVVFYGGSFDYEVSFNIVSPYGATLYTSTAGDFSTTEDGTVIFSLWTHCTEPTCPEPSDLEVDAVYSFSADLSWTENGTATAWDLIFGTPGFDPFSEGTIAEDVSNPGTVTGLNAETDYEVYVRSDCGGETSYWVGPVILTTLPSCPAPTAFTNEGETPDGINLSWNAGGTETLWNLIYGTPGFDPESEGTTVSGVDVSDYALTGLDSETEYDVYLQADCSGGDLSSLVGPINFTTLPACPEPWDLTATNITSSSAELNWIEWGAASLWDILYGESGFDPETEGTLIEGINVAPYNLEGLDPETEYDVYVRADCNPELSVWVGPTTFTTLPTCPEPTDLLASNITSTSAELVWTEMGTAAEWEIVYGVTGFDPDIEGTLETGINTTMFTLNDLSAATSYDAYVRAICDVSDISSWSAVETFSTELCEPTDQCDFTFNLIDSWGDGWNGNNIDIFQNGIFVDNLTLATGSSSTETVTLCPGLSTSIVFHTGSFISEVSFNIVTPWGETIYNGSGFVTGDNNQEIFSWVAACEPPTCPEPTNLIADIITGHTASIIWTEAGDATQWNVLYGLDGFDPMSGGTLIEDLNAETYLIEGLDPLTDYDVYVQANCGVDDLSFWAGPLSFTTDVACPSVVDTELVDATHESITINIVSGGLETNWNIVYGLHGFIAGEGTTVSVSENPFTISGLIADTEYDFYIQADCGAVDGTSTWEGPFVYSTTVPCPDVWNLTLTDVIYDSGVLSWEHSSAQDTWDIEVGLDGFAPGTGNEEFLFSGVQDNPFTITGLTSETEYDVYIMSDCGALGYSNWVGPVDLNTLNPCPEVWDITVSDIGEYGATVSWSSVYYQDTWNIEVGLPGFTPGNGEAVVQENGVTDNPFILTGLDPDTEYEVYIMADCDALGESDWVSPSSTFSTIPTCIEPTDVVITNISFESATISWTPVGSANTWNIEVGLQGFTPFNGEEVVSNTVTGDTFWDITGLNNTTSYDVYIQSDCGAGDLSYIGGPYGFSTTDPYCNAGPSSTVDSNVEQVDITGENDTEISHTGCPGVTYVQNLTQYSVDVYQGQTYSLAVLFGSCSSGNYSGAGQVWIDWDQNNTYDTEESIGTSSGVPGTAPWNAPVNFEFDVPADAEIGVTRMRVMQHEGGSLPLDPCGTYTWGSVMDFSVNVLPTPPNSEANIIEYSFAEQTAPAVIDAENQTVTIEVAADADLTNLVATYILSEGATASIGGVEQESGVTTNNFSSDVVYLVTAEDETTTLEWTVTVTQEVLNNEADILTYTFGAGIDYEPATIDNVEKTVFVWVNEGTDLNSLVAEFTLSDGANASVEGTPQVSGETENDFSMPVTYLVTAEDEVTSNEWEVTVSIWSSIDAENGISKLSLYPNPSDGIINLSLINYTDEFTYTIYDVEGRSIMMKEINVKGEYTETIDLNVAPGSYFITIESDKYKQTEKFIVK